MGCVAYPSVCPKMPWGRRMGRVTGKDRAHSRKRQLRDPRWGHHDKLFAQHVNRTARRRGLVRGAGRSERRFATQWLRRSGRRVAGDTRLGTGQRASRWKRRIWRGHASGKCCNARNIDRGTGAELDDGREIPEDNLGQAGAPPGLLRLRHESRGKRPDDGVRFDHGRSSGQVRSPGPERLPAEHIRSAGGPHRRHGAGGDRCADPPPRCPPRRLCASS